MKIEKVKIEDLKPYENNAKLHPQEQIDEIKKSIEEFGNNDPIAIDENNIIIEGHGRYLALQQLGYKQVEVIRLSHLTEEQRKAYTLVHNKLTMDTGFDMELLMMELDEIQDIDMRLLGFEEELKVHPSTLEEDDFDEDDIPEGVPPKARYGEIYQLGDHFLMCGDSTKHEDVAELMNGEEADLCVTDPPYNVDYEGATEDKLKIMNDSMSEASFIEFLADAFSTMKANLKEGGAFYIWHADGHRYEFLEALRRNSLQIRQALVWVKNGIVMGRQDYQWKHEPCLYGWKDGASHYFVNDRTQSTIIEDAPNINKMDKDQLKTYVKELIAQRDQRSTIIREDKPSRSAEHPTMKPVKLIGQSIFNSSREGDIVLDLFGGSGSTLIACQQLNRRCRIMELDPKFVDVIIKRWEDFTGQKAVLIE